MPWESMTFATLSQMSKCSICGMGRLWGCVSVASRVCGFQAMCQEARSGAAHGGRLERCGSGIACLHIIRDT